MQENAPWFVWLILEVVGVTLIASGIPLARRRVRPNMLYGARFEATLRDEKVWYEINSRCGRHFIVIGATYLLLLNALLLAAVDDMTVIWLSLAILIGAPLIDAVVLYRAANRLVRASTSVGSPRP